MTPVNFIHADVIAGLRQVETDSVHCCITSPPYWGLRNYGIEPSCWGGQESCSHAWVKHEAATDHRLESPSRRDGSDVTDRGETCLKCFAWRGCLGLEPTPELYVEHLVYVFQHVRRTLHPTGTLWLNLGDSYVCEPHGAGHTFDPKYAGRNRREGYTANRLGARESGLKSKDLVMMPARVAMALQADGWYLRQQIPWIKRNGMPESANDRPTSMVEYIYLFSRQESYFYDRAAIMLPQSKHERTRRLAEQSRGLNTVYTTRRDGEAHGQVKPGRTGVAKSVAARQALAVSGVRSRRNSDWFFESLRGMVVDHTGEALAMLVNPQPFGMERCTGCDRNYTLAEFRRLERIVLPDDSTTRVCRLCGGHAWLSHFATFPEALVRPCLLAGTSEFGVCDHCLAPYERVLVKAGRGNLHGNAEQKRARINGNWKKHAVDAPEDLGWTATCSHPLFPGTPTPATVLDPFGGAGTTAIVARKHGRGAVLIDRNAAYIDMAKFRLERSQNGKTKPEPDTADIGAPG